MKSCLANCYRKRLEAVGVADGRRVRTVEEKAENLDENGAPLGSKADVEDESR